MRRAPALITLAAALAVPSSAAAAWSAPQTISSAHEFVDAPRVIIAGNGNPLAVWATGDGTGSRALVGTGEAPRGRLSALFGPSHALLAPTRLDQRPSLATGPVAYGRNRAIVAVQRAVVADPHDPRIRLTTRFGSTKGRFAAGRVVRVAPGIRSVSLAAAPSGAAVLAWFEDRGVRTDRVYVSLRSPGGRFGAPRRLATGRVRSVAAAIGAAGDALVAWDERGTLKTRYKPHARSGFRAAQTIATAGGERAYGADLHPAVARDGHAVLAWSSQLATEGGSSGPLYFEAAERPARGRFTRAQLLEKLGSDQVPRPIRAAADDQGGVELAWSGSDGLNRRVRVAGETATRRAFAAPVTVSLPGSDAVLSDLAAGPKGALLAVWDNGGFDANQVLAALKADSGTGFGAPEAVSPPEQARDGHGAFRGDGRPIVVWTNRPNGSTKPIRTYAQAAIRLPMLAD